MPKTPRRLTVNPPTLRQVEVVRVTDLSPGMRRVTLAGAQLGEFVSANGYAQPAFDSSGFDDSIRLLFCSPGETEPVLPVQQATGLDMPRDRRLRHDPACDLEAFDELSRIVFVAEQPVLDQRRRVGMGRAQRHSPT